MRVDPSDIPILLIVALDVVLDIRDGYYAQAVGWIFFTGVYLVAMYVVNRRLRDLRRRIEKSEK